VVVLGQALLGVGDGFSLADADSVLLDERELVARALVEAEDAPVEQVAVQAAVASLGDPTERQVLLVLVYHAESGHATEPLGAGKTDDEHRQRRCHRVLRLSEQGGLGVVERHVGVPRDDGSHPVMERGRVSAHVQLTPPGEVGEREAADDDQYRSDPDHPGADVAVLLFEVGHPSLERLAEQAVLTAPFDRVPPDEHAEQPTVQAFQPVAAEDVPDGVVGRDPVPQRRTVGDVWLQVVDDQHGDGPRREQTGEEPDGSPACGLAAACSEATVRDGEPGQCQELHRIPHKRLVHFPEEVIGACDGVFPHERGDGCEDQELDEVHGPAEDLVAGEAALREQLPPLGLCFRFGEFRTLPSGKLLVDGDGSHGYSLLE